MSKDKEERTTSHPKKTARQNRAEEREINRQAKLKGEGRDENGNRLNADGSRRYDDNGLRILVGDE